MIHHSSKDYKQAASEAAAIGREKIESMIEKGSTQATAVIENISNTIIDDNLANARDMIFRPNTNGQMVLSIDTNGGNFEKILHRNAIYQAVSLGKVTKFDEVGAKISQTGNIFPNPQKFIDSFYAIERPDLLGQVLTQEFQMAEKRRHLIRSVNGDTRAILSNSFKRIDARPLLEKFVEACQNIGAFPFEGYVEDTRLVIRAILPMVFEPVKDEIMAFGIEWRTSDFGHGANTISLFNVRTMCTNLAMTNDILRQIHLGKRLDESIIFSQETYEAESNMMALMFRDVVNNCLSPERIDAYLKGIKEADDKEIKGKDIGALLKRHGLTTDQRDEVIEEFTSGEIVMLPPKQTVWRLANALTWAAQSKTDNDERFLYQKVAGKILPQVDIKAVEVPV